MRINKIQEFTISIYSRVSLKAPLPATLSSGEILGKVRTVLQSSHVYIEHNFNPDDDPKLNDVLLFNDVVFIIFPSNI